MTRVRRATEQTFRSLHERNFRLFFAGQAVSATGTWMQSVAQAWLVLRLTDSGVSLGITFALQFVPMLVFGAWSGVLADRYDKRRILIATAAVSGLLSGALGILTATGSVRLWMVYVFAFAYGCATAADNPARRAFVNEMVHPENVSNAVGLTSAVFTSARVVGPAIAGLLIAGFGLAWCFGLNAISFIAVIWAFLAMNRQELRTVPPVPRQKRQVREGLSYAWANPALRIPLLMTVVVGTFVFNWQVVLPVLAQNTFDGGPGTFGMLYAFLSIGSVAGALVSAHEPHATQRFVTIATLALGISMLGAAVAPGLPLELLLLVPVGAAAQGFTTMVNGVLQTYSAPEMRGRVLSLFSVAFLGSTPIGGPIVGWVCQQFGARAGLAVGAASALVAGTAAMIWALRHAGRGIDRSAPSPAPAG